MQVSITQLDLTQSNHAPKHTFKLINKLQNEYTCNNLPLERQSIKMAILTIPVDLKKEDMLALKINKNRVFPKIVTKLAI